MTSRSAGTAGSAGPSSTLGVQVPEGAVIGYDAAEDRAAGYHVTENGVTVVPSP